MNELMKPNYELQVSNPAAVAAAEGAKARIQSAYIMAVQRPRNEEDARQKILAACKRPRFAEKAEYNKPIGKEKIKGPSIRFAELALTKWGNVIWDTQIIFDDDMTRRVKVSVTDLETNSCPSREIQFSKTVERQNKKGREDDVVGERKNTWGKTVYILRATDEELQIKESAMVSKVLRNEGLRLIPWDIVEEAMDTARETLRSRDKTDPESARRKILDAFNELGVMPSDIEAYLKKTIKQVNEKDLQDLRGVYRSIRDGESKWSDYVQDVPEKSIADAIAAEKQVEVERLVEVDLSKGALKQFKSLSQSDPDGILAAMEAAGVVDDPETDDAAALILAHYEVEK